VSAGPSESVCVCVRVKIKYQQKRRSHPPDSLWIIRSQLTQTLHAERTSKATEAEFTDQALLSIPFTFASPLRVEKQPVSKQQSRRLES
jgi:hypothetical protein